MVTKPGIKLTLGIPKDRNHWFIGIKLTFCGDLSNPPPPLACLICCSMGLLASPPWRWCCHDLDIWWNPMISNNDIEQWYRTTCVSDWWFQPHWKIWKSVGITIPNIWKNKKCSKPPTRYIIYNYNIEVSWVLMCDKILTSNESNDTVSVSESHGSA